MLTIGEMVSADGQDSINDPTLRGFPTAQFSEPARTVLLDITFVLLGVRSRVNWP